MEKRGKGEDKIKKGGTQRCRPDLRDSKCLSFTVAADQTVIHRCDGMVFEAVAIPPAAVAVHFDMSIPTAATVINANVIVAGAGRAHA